VPVIPEHIDAGPVIVGTGEAFIVTGAVAVTTPHPPAAAIVLVTVYMPGVLADRFICPVAVFTKTKPVVDENVPATPLR
jgi:hypothetical protein